MISRFRSLFKVTAVRLSIIYTLIFGVLAVGIVAYMTGATVKVLREQLEVSINGEVLGLARIYDARGLRSLVNNLERRARAPGANLYLVTDASGTIIAGNVPRIENGVMQRVGWTKRPFKYSRFGDRPENDHRAIARVLQLPNGLRMLVGRDIGEAEQFRHIVGRALQLAIGTMLALGVLTWFFVGRRALRRIDQVSKSTQRIMGGDRSERLPVSGAGDEFDRLSANLNRMLDRIGTLDEGLKQMSDNIAHDLKTPITRLRNKAEEALRAPADSETAEERISDIIRDCDQIVRTFDALLMISRVESGATVAKLEPTKINALLSDVYDLYEAVAEDQGFKLQLQLLSDDISIQANRELLSQALANLIDNTLKYGKAESAPSSVVLKAVKAKNTVELSVADNGPGIPEAERERVVERFVRLDRSRRTSGNGLGLSLVAAIANLHAGELLLADNQPGLVATIALPDGGKSA